MYFTKEAANKRTYFVIKNKVKDYNYLQNV